MKRLLTTLAFTFAVCSWGMATPLSYTITGTVPAKMDGKQIILNKKDGALTVLDSTTITNRTFTFKGRIANPEMGVLLVNMGRGNKPTYDVILEKGNITVTIDSIGHSVSGTPINNAQQQYNDKIGQYKEKADILRQEYAKVKPTPEMYAKRDSLLAPQKNLTKEVDAYTSEFISKNINNPAGQQLLSYRCPHMKLEELKTYMAKATPKAKQTAIMKAIQERIDTLDKVAIGKKYTDVRMFDPEGKEVALSDYVGKSKLVMLDFWASWCGPCGAEAPVVVKTYNKYKDKGFEIVGVSLDKTPKAWADALAAYKFTWPQMSDFKVKEGEAVKAYGVGSIPHMVLIDQDGKIVAERFRAAELDAMLEKLLK